MYIDVKNAKLVQILLGISTKISHKNKFRVQILLGISKLKVQNLSKYCWVIDQNFTEKPILGEGAG